MRHLYTLTFLLSLPLILLRMLWRSLRGPAYRRRWGERFGFYPLPALAESLWIHAVSVGEVQAVEPLVRKLLELHPELPLVITTTTPTGSERVSQLFGDAVRHVYFPYDLPFSVKRFLRFAAPRLLVMVETEIWPNLLFQCQRRGIVTLLANARLSERSARGYARLGAFTRETFRRISRVAAQGEADAERFVRLGLPAERVLVTGSIKFDIRLPASLHEQAAALRHLWGDRPIWVAASTHEGEEAELLAAHRQLRESLPQALLVLVPRHPERFERVAELAQRMGFRTVRRSTGMPVDPKTELFLGDTMGELSLFLAAADAAFVGGSLIPRGGHNILEPAALGKPVLFGPHMFNFAAISELFLEQGAAKMVKSSEELAWVMERWLSDASERSRIGENGRALVEQNRGALERLLGLIEDLLPGA
jgi:3-deoxy-D-manno-octulosonic-acid transferase